MQDNRDFGTPDRPVLCSIGVKTVENYGDMWINRTIVLYREYKNSKMWLIVSIFGPHRTLDAESLTFYTVNVT